MLQQHLQKKITTTSKTTNKVINTTEEDTTKIKDQSQIFKQLLLIPRVEQRTPAWYDMRKGMITASSAASLLIRDDTCDPYIEEFNLQDVFKKDGKCCNPYSSKREYMLRKFGERSFKGNSATRWGTKYEPVATQIYERWSSSDIPIEDYSWSHIKDLIIEFGLIPHPKYPWLGASPDGITEKGVMLEIKCPVSRAITGIPPLYYWIQMQLQLEVCDLERCDFIECRFKEISKETYEDLPTDVHNRKGLIVAVKKNRELEEGEDEYEYIYPDRDVVRHRSLELWADNVTRNTKDSHILYWSAEEVSIVTVKRSRVWFESVKDKLHKAQIEIDELKSNKRKLREFIDNGEVKVDLYHPPKGRYFLSDSDSDS